MKISKNIELVGIGFKPFDFKLDGFHGYYISILTFSLSYKKKESWCTLGGDYSCFYLGIHKRENGGILFVMRLFWVLFRFYIIPQKFVGCKECKYKVEEEDTGGRTPEFWCNKCGKYISKEDTEIIISNKI